MRFTKILKDSIFPLLCFIAMQVLALIIEPYSKTYLCESFYTGKGVIASLFTGVIYNFFVFSIYLLLFLRLFYKIPYEQKSDNKNCYCRYSLACNYRVC